MAQGFGAWGLINIQVWVDLVFGFLVLNNSTYAFRCLVVRSFRF